MTSKADLLQRIASFLPTNVSPALRESLTKQIDFEIEQLIAHAKRDAVLSFCEENNLCPVCITGGQLCTSDHK